MDDVQKRGVVQLPKMKLPNFLSLPATGVMRET
jgi:hypothetical protein